MYGTPRMLSGSMFWIARTACTPASCTMSVCAAPLTPSGVHTGVNRPSFPAGSGELAAEPVEATMRPASARTAAMPKSARRDRRTRSRSDMPLPPILFLQSRSGATSVLCAPAARRRRDFKGKSQDSARDCLTAQTSLARGGGPASPPAPPPISPCYGRAIVNAGDVHVSQSPSPPSAFCTDSVSVYVPFGSVYVLFPATVVPSIVYALKFVEVLFR